MSRASESAPAMTQILLHKNNVVRNNALRSDIHVGHKCFVTVFEIAAYLTALIGSNDVVIETVEAGKYAGEVELVCFDGEFVMEGVFGLVERCAEDDGTVGLDDAGNFLKGIIVDRQAHDDDASGSFDRACLCKTINDINECEETAVVAIFADNGNNVEAFEGYKFEGIVDVLRVEDELVAVRELKFAEG